ncbi:MAG: hypothetical protein RLZZ15_1535 [Verrucomicrobiota bacterium]
MSNALPIPADECERVCARLATLRAGLGRAIPPTLLRPNPPAPATGPDAFVASRWFAVFDRLAPAAGWTLDYLYDFHGNSGAPRLYTRPTDARPLATRAELERHTAEVFSRPVFLDHVELAEGDPDAALHLVWFALEAPKFYLRWHAQYLNDEFVVSTARLEELLEKIPGDENPGPDFRRVIGEPARAALRALDLRPRVALGPDGAEVTALAFGKWAGFHWHRARIRRERHGESLTLEVTREIVAPYHCGIML